MVMVRMGMVMVAPPQQRVGMGSVVFFFVFLLMFPGRPIVLFVIDADESSHELWMRQSEHVYFHPCKIIDSQHATQPIFIAQEPESFRFSSIVVSDQVDILYFSPSTTKDPIEKRTVKTCI